jgi:hypothetical protein
VETLSSGIKTLLESREVTLYRFYKDSGTLNQTTRINLEIKFIVISGELLFRPDLTAQMVACRMLERD